MSALEKIPAFQKLKNKVVGDGNATATATAELLEKITHILKQVEEEIQQQQEEQEEQQEEQGQQGDDNGENGDDNGDDQQGDNGDSDDNNGEGEQGEGEGNGDEQGDDNGEGEGEGSDNGESGNGEGEQSDNGEGQGEGEQGDDSGQQGNGQQSENNNENGESGNDDNGDEYGDTTDEEQGGNGEGDLSEELLKALEDAVEEAVEEANNKIDEQSKTLQGAGVGEGDSRLDIENQQEIIHNAKYNEKLKGILDLCGRMLDNPKSKPTLGKTLAGVDVTGVTESNDITGLLPVELMNFADDNMETLFYKRFTEQKLLTVNRRGHKKMGRGPAIICVDESGSMEGRRDTVAKAFTLASVQALREDRRDSCVITYDFTVCDIYKYTKAKNVEVQLYGNNSSQQVSYSQAISLYTRRFQNGGGTDFNSVLHKAMDVFKSNNRMDIIFITDGDADVFQSTIKKLNALKKKKGLRVTCILIGLSEVSEAVEQISDTIFHVDNLSDEDQIIQALAKAREE